MITAYVGLPGSGKSYGVLQNVIVPALSKGRDVWTNIPCNASALIDHCGASVTQFVIEYILKNDRWFLDVLPKGVVCVLDEAWRLWPSGMHANKINSTHKEYMAEIRHLVDSSGNSSQLVIVTQDLAQLANFTRTLVETTFKSVKLKAVGSDKRFRVDSYSGAVTGHSPPKAKLISQNYYRYRKEIQALYQSHTKSDAGAGNEKSIDTRASVFGNLTFKLLPFIFVGACWFLWYAIGQLKIMYNVGDEKPAEALPSVPATAPIRPEPPRRPPDDFFKGRDTYITLNMGRGPKTVYRFESIKGESWVALDAYQVKKLGYRVIMISDCLVFFEKDAFRVPVTCRSVQSKKQNLVADLIEPVGADRKERSE